MSTEPQTYTLHDIRNIAGWPQDVRFMVVPDSDAGTMPEPPTDRQTEILGRLAAVWARWPHQRLGQLLANAITNANLLRLLPDVELMSDLEQFYGRHA